MVDVEPAAGRRRFSFVGGSLALDFANTYAGTRRGEGIEHLETYDDLVEWGQQAGVLAPMESAWLRREAAASPGRAAAVQKKAHALREAVWRVFEAVAARRQAPASDVAAISDEAARVLGRSRLVPDGARYRWDRVEKPDDLDALLWPVVRSAAQLLVAGPLDRVRHCASETCDWLFLDTSRNRSRRWCAMSECGNRAKVKRHYRRERRRVAKVSPAKR